MPVRIFVFKFIFLKKKGSPSTPFFLLLSLEGHILVKEYTTWWMTNFHQNYQNKPGALLCRFPGPSPDLPSQHLSLSGNVKKLPILEGNQVRDPLDMTLPLLPPLWRVSLSIAVWTTHRLSAASSTRKDPFRCQGQWQLLGTHLTGPSRAGLTLVIIAIL